MFVSLESPSEPAWLTDLNPEQRAAAEHEGGHLLILAGAGTGKTTTLCARVGRLIEDGASPERILLLTFSRRAAREMIGRAVALTGAHLGGGARRIAGGTFHAMAHRFVRGAAAALGLTADFGLLAAGFDHVLVDEYQDVNELQVEVVAALAGHGATVTAVGDDFQAIYGFRSASADHLLGFTERFPGAATVLPVSYTHLT